MKKISLLSLTLFCAITLFAKEPVFTYHAGGYFGKNFADTNSMMRDDTLYGIRGTVMLTPFYGINVGYERMDKIDIKDSGSTIDLQRLYTQIEVDGEEQYHVVPYITIGMGYEFLSNDIVINGKKHDVSQAFLSGGLGFRYNFIPELSIFAEGNTIWKIDTSDVDYTALLGLMYHINATTCDDTYVTERMNEKPQERNVIHVGSVNNLSGWDKPGSKAALSKKPKVTKSVIIDEKPQKAVKIVQKLTSPKVKKSYKVKYPVAKKAHKTSGAYYISVGAFRTKSGLLSVQKKLKKADIPYNTKKGSKTALTYVVVGPFDTRSKARKKLSAVKRVQSDAYIAKLN